MHTRCNRDANTDRACRRAKSSLLSARSITWNCRQGLHLADSVGLKPLLAAAFEPCIRRGRGYRRTLLK